MRKGLPCRCQLPPLRPCLLLPVAASWPFCIAAADIVHLQLIISIDTSTRCRYSAVIMDEAHERSLNTGARVGRVAGRVRRDLPSLPLCIPGSLSLPAQRHFVCHPFVTCSSSLACCSQTCCLAFSRRWWRGGATFALLSPLVGCLGGLLDGRAAGWAGGAQCGSQRAAWAASAWRTRCAGPRAAAPRSFPSARPIALHPRRVLTRLAAYAPQLSAASCSLAVHNAGS
mgnify:CR=1 FL=1